MQQQMYGGSGGQGRARGKKFVRRGMWVLGIGLVMLCVCVLLALDMNLIVDTAMYIGLSGLSALGCILFGFIFILIGCMELYRKLYIGVGIQFIYVLIMLMGAMTQKIGEIFLPGRIYAIIAATNLLGILMLIFTLPGILFIIEDIVDMYKKRNVP